MGTPLLQGLPPVVDADAGVLILGSFPSVRSLADGQYYANPRNAFWPIVTEVLGFDCTAPYSRRVAALQKSGVALWDVLHSCRRAGSADSAIDPKCLVVNDFGALFAEYPAITRVYFNGAKAADLFERLVRITPPGFTFTRLPSTSPANAIPRERKLAAWKVIGQSG
ncbi:DNA-deoxyinosine glycosylase [Mycobacterium asiaticum]|uniref:DNA-deoxyinosine glycosylase n=1 Tax=Mycobacterium asiaticum TaxID=1790 RepID=UPI00056B95B7|nr:DNA-deoxyinosine glycosylase [Mycobacterium asiaticum]ORA09539.1 DNA-deoxyinosine glycosylase [Mycobacterium asiaticum DSM 44297]